MNEQTNRNRMKMSDNTRRKCGKTLEFAVDLAVMVIVLFGERSVETRRCVTANRALDDVRRQTGCP